MAGYGKLGGLELGYGSDLDLVFLHDSSGEFQQTDGRRPIDNGVFFLRLGQRIVHLLTMHSAAGRLYEVDMRLRPNGKGGFLMTGIDAFERYQHHDAWTWEHQALLRARAVAGDAGLVRRFEAARRRVLCTAVRRDTLRTDVTEMRSRMRRELSRGGAGTVRHQAGCGRHRRHRVPGAVLGAGGGGRASGARRRTRTTSASSRGLRACAGSCETDDGAVAQGSLHRLSYACCTTCRWKAGSGWWRRGPHAETRARGRGDLAQHLRDGRGRLMRSGSDDHADSDPMRSISTR